MRLYWCGNQKASGGVGIMLAKKWVDKVFEVQRITDRILMLKLIISKQIFTFVALYARQMVGQWPRGTVSMTSCRVLSWGFLTLRKYSSLETGMAMLAL